MENKPNYTVILDYKYKDIGRIFTLYGHDYKPNIPHKCYLTEDQVHHIKTEPMKKKWFRLSKIEEKKKQAKAKKVEKPKRVVKSIPITEEPKL